MGIIWLSLELNLHYLIVEASHCRPDDHSGLIKKLEEQLDQVVALAQQYKQRYGPLN